MFGKKPQQSTPRPLTSVTVQPRYNAPEKDYEEEQEEGLPEVEPIRSEYNEKEQKLIAAKKELESSRRALAEIQNKSVATEEEIEEPEETQETPMQKPKAIQQQTPQIQPKQPEKYAYVVACEMVGTNEMNYVIRSNIAIRPGFVEIKELGGN